MTRKRNEINELLSTPMPHIDELKKRAQDLETVMEKFQIAHENYHQNLKDDEDVEESNEYFEAEQTRVNYLVERIMNVIDHHLLLFLTSSTLMILSVTPERANCCPRNTPKLAANLVRIFHLQSEAQLQARRQRQPQKRLL